MTDLISPHSLYSNIHNAIVLFNPGLGDLVMEEIKSIHKNPWFPEKAHSQETGFFLFHDRIRIKNISFRSLVSISFRTFTAKDIFLLMGRTNLKEFQNNPDRFLKIWSEYFSKKNIPYSFYIDCQIQKSSIQDKVLFLQNHFPYPSYNDRSIHLPREKNYRIPDDCIRLMISIREESVEFYIGMEDLPNYRRGFREEVSNSYPLSEDIASILCKELDTYAPSSQNKTRYYIPFSGTGTLGWEAWMQEENLYPGIFKKTSPLFSKLADWEDSWKFCHKKTLSLWKDKICTSERVNSRYILSDWSEDAVENTKNNLRNLENISLSSGEKSSREDSLLHKQLQEDKVFRIWREDFFASDISELTTDGQSVRILLHPPYGIRSGRKENSRSFYNRLTLKLLEWKEKADPRSKISGFILAPDSNASFVSRNNLKQKFFTKIRNLSQGKLSVRAIFFW